jgi:hypothetical protein
MTRVDRDRYAPRLTYREGTTAMRTYRTLLASGALAPLALGAATIVHGEWQTALAALAGLIGVAFLLSLTRLLAIGDGLARPAPAAEPRREAAPAAVAPPRQAPPEPRPGGLRRRSAPRPRPARHASV